MTMYIIHARSRHFAHLMAMELHLRTDCWKYFNGEKTLVGLNREGLIHINEGIFDSLKRCFYKNEIPSPSEKTAELNELKRKGTLFWEEDHREPRVYLQYKKKTLFTIESLHLHFFVFKGKREPSHYHYNYRYGSHHNINNSLDDFDIFFYQDYSLKNAKLFCERESEGVLNEVLRRKDHSL